MSVPNQNCADGAFNRRVGTTCSGSIVPSHGARTAIRIISSSTMPPAIAVGCRRSVPASQPRIVGAGVAAAGGAIATEVIELALVANARVEQRVAEIDEQV